MGVDPAKKKQKLNKGPPEKREVLKLGWNVFKLFESMICSGNTHLVRLYNKNQCRDWCEWDGFPH